MSWFDQHPDSTYLGRGLNNARNQDGSLRSSGVLDAEGWVYVLVMPDEHGNHDDNDAQPERPQNEADDLRIALRLSLLQDQDQSASAEAADAAALEEGIQASVAFATAEAADAAALEEAIQASVAFECGSRAAGAPSAEAGPSSARPELESLGNCSICLDAMASDEDTTQLSCAGGHRFHSICALPWLQSHGTCPNCRERVGRGVGGRGGGGGGSAASSAAGGPIRRQRRGPFCAWNNNDRGAPCDRPPMDGNYNYCSVHRKPCPKRDCILSGRRHIVGHPHLR